MNLCSKVLFQSSFKLSYLTKCLSVNNKSTSTDLIFSKKKSDNVSSSEKADNISRAMVYYLEKLNERGIC